MIRTTLRNSAAVRIARQAPVAAMAATAGAVVLVDGITKAIALLLIPELEVAPTGWLALAVVHNLDLAWGLAAGAESATVTAVATLAIVGLATLVCGGLAAHDRAAPLMLGLVAGAGAANAMDAFTAPAGVLDWIAVGGANGVVLNLADVAVVAGVALALRTAWRLMAEIRGGARNGCGHG
jgi:lipoprotein signal peptidase